MITIRKSAHRSYLIGEVIVLAMRLCVPLTSYGLMPEDMRLPLVKIGVAGVCLICFVIFLAELVYYLRYRLVLSIQGDSLVIEETRSVLTKKIKMNYPLEAKCRNLGRGIPQMIYVKSRNSQKEAFFGKALCANEQEDIITILNRNEDGYLLGFDQ